MSTLPQIKWIVNNSQLSPLNGIVSIVSNGYDLALMYVSKSGNIYLSSYNNNGLANSLPTGTVNELGAVITTGGYDVYLQKWTTDGIRVWSRSGSIMNNGGTDYPTGLFADDNGGVYVTAYAQSPIAGIVPFDNTGNRDPVWYKLVDGVDVNGNPTVPPTFTRAWGFAKPIATAANTSNGENQILVGNPNTNDLYTATSTPFLVTWPLSGQATTQYLGNNDMVFAKINSTTGVIEWIVQDNRFNSGANDIAQRIVVGADGHLVVVCTGSTNRLMKINGTNGSPIWIQPNVLYATTHTNFKTVVTDLDNNIYVCMAAIITPTATGVNSTVPAVIGGSDILIMKFNSSGNRLWTIRPASINTTSGELDCKIDVDTDGNVYLAYISAGTVAGQPKIGLDDISLAKITTDGVVEWVYTLPAEQMNMATAERLASIKLDKYRNIYLYYTTIGKLSGTGVISGTLSNTTSNHCVLAKLGPAEQISYDPADQAPPTPLLTNVTVAASAVIEDTIPNGFSIPSVITTLGANLISPGQSTGIAIYAANITNGVWQYSINNGGLWTTFPAVSESSYLLLNGTGTIVRYIPNANSTTATSISYRAWSGQASWNGNIYAAGSFTAITYGDNTPFSNGTATTTLAITPVNDAPTMNAATYVLPNLSTSNTDTGVDLLTLMNNFNMADVDLSTLDITQLGIAIMSADTTLGEWEYSETNGTSWLPLGVVSMASAVHLNIASATLIRFIPTLTQSSGSTNITFVGWDKSNAASLVNKRTNVSSRGGANPYSASIGTLTRTIIAPPTVPRSIKASIGNDSITFNWVAPLFYGFDGTMSYNIYDATNTLITTVTGTTATITADTTAASFLYTISANNSLLEGPTSSSISYLGGPVFETIERSHMEFDLSWSAPYTQGPNSIITYDIINADTNLLMESNLTDTFTSLNGNLVAGQTYNIMVRAKMNGIIANSNIQTAIVPFIPIPIPQTPQLGNGQLTIAWNNTSSLVQGATFLGYKIYYRKDGSAEYVTSLISETTTTITGLQGTFDSITINATSATFTGLINGDLYKFRIVTVADIDGDITNGPSSIIIRGIPIAPTITVSNLSASISSAVADNDTASAVNAINALNESEQGKVSVIQSFTDLAAGTAVQAAVAGGVFVGLPTASATLILQSIINATATSAATNAATNASLLGNAMQTNASQVGNIITGLGTLIERKSAVVAAVEAIVQSTSSSLLSAALTSGMITSNEVRQAVGASDISARISVSTIAQGLSAVVDSFSASMAEVKASSDESKIEIIRGSVEQIMRTSVEAINNVSSTAAEKVSAKENSIIAILKEANAEDINSATKNTFVGAIKDNFAGQTIELSTEAKTTLLDSIPVGRIDTSLIDNTKSLSVIVPNATEILLSKVLPNQFVAMELNIEYTFKNIDNVNDTPIVATYKQAESGARYLEQFDGTQIQLGGRVVMFDHPFFLAAAASPIITPATVPPAPTNVVATRTVGSGTINIEFTQSGDGGDIITSYEYSTNGTTFVTTGLTWTTGQNTLSIAGLTQGQSYSITLRAKNGAGPGAQSNSVLIAIPTVPNPPTNVVATRGDSQAIITFTAPVNNGNAVILSYKITVIENGTVTTRMITITNLSAPISVTIDALTNGTSYSFKVVAVNEMGDSAFSLISNAVVPTSAPNTPTNLTAEAMNTSVIIQFEQISIETITGYQYSTDNTNFKTDLLWTQGSKYVVIRNLSSGETYTFVLKSVNDAGISAYSDPVTVTISTSVSKPIEVNFNVMIEGTGELSIFSSPPQLVTNFIEAECKLPVEALYDADKNEGLIELWEPSLDPDNIYVKLASSNKDGINLTDSFKRTAKKLVLGIQKILCDKFDCKDAPPFTLYKNSLGNPITEYTTQRDFGRVALSVFAHYLIGHVDATAAITNDVGFIKSMLSISSDAAVINETNGALDRYNSYTNSNFMNTTDVLSWPRTGTPADANLAICLVREIIAKGLDTDSNLMVSDVNNATSSSLANIVKQVVGQDATRLMNVDNNQRTKDQVQLLRFYPNDTIYLNIKLARPTITMGEEQLVTPISLQNRYQSEVSFTLKITLE